MIEDGEVRPEGCICEPCSDIPPNWRDMRSKFGYTTLYSICPLAKKKDIGKCPLLKTNI